MMWILYLALLLVIPVLFIRAFAWFWLYISGWERWNLPSGKYWVKKSNPRLTVQGRVWKPIILELEDRKK